MAAAFVCLTGRIGAVYHISFPVTARASFGIWGSYWPVFNRAAMAVIWYGVQAYIGGESSLVSYKYKRRFVLISHPRRMCDIDDPIHMAELW